MSDLLLYKLHLSMIVRFYLLCRFLPFTDPPCEYISNLCADECWPQQPHDWATCSASEQICGLISRCTPTSGAMRYVWIPVFCQSISHAVTFSECMQCSSLFNRKCWGEILIFRSRNVNNEMFCRIGPIQQLFIALLCIVLSVKNCHNASVWDYNPVAL